jgi:hypothetical protein
VSGSGFVQIEIKSANKRSKNEESNIGGSMLTVFCEEQWLVIQQRLNGFETNFNRSWSDYQKGFGSLHSDFWIGLEPIYQLTHANSYQLLIELTDWSDNFYTAHYDSFQIGNAQDFYRLSLGGQFTGNASKDYLQDMYFGFSSQNGAYFSTYDHDYNKIVEEKQKDINSQSFDRTIEKLIDERDSNSVYKSSATFKLQKDASKSCASRLGSGWWFSDSHSCLPVNLNGVYVTGASAPSTRGIKWQAINEKDRNYALKKSKIKIKPNF